MTSYKCAGKVSGLAADDGVGAKSFRISVWAFEREVGLKGKTNINAENIMPDNGPASFTCIVM